MSDNVEVDARNRRASDVERLMWLANPPERYFAYVSEKPNRTITTWMGDYLGNASLGIPYRSNMGDTRQSIAVVGNNGREYYGTYYTSSGDYCRLRARKNSR